MRRVAAVFSSVLLLTGLVACGGGGSSGGAGSAGVDDWVDGVCGRMLALDHELNTEQAELSARIGSATEPKDLLDALDEYVTNASGFVKLASEDISRLGAPSIASRNEVVGDVDDLFYQYRSDSADIGTSVKKALGDASTTQTDALLLVGELGRLGDIGDEMQAVLDDYDELSASFEDSDTCQRWVDQSEATTTTPASTTTAPPTTTVSPTTTTPTTVPTTTVPPTTAAPTTLPATTVPPTAPPVTADPYLVARDLYNAAADEYNPKFDLLWSTWYDEDGYILYKDAPTYCSQYATLQREWNDRMSAIPWPADAQDEANIHITEGTILIGMLDQCAAAPGTRAGVDALLTDIEAEEETYYMTIDPLRMAIGLSPIYGG